MSKKLIWTIVAVVAVIVVAVVSVVFLKPKTEANVEGTLEEIMAKVYAGIPEENLPMLGQMPVDSTDADSVRYYLGTSEVSFKDVTEVIYSFKVSLTQSLNFIVLSTSIL